MLQQVIDTHVHIWDFDKADYDWLNGNTSILNRNYAIDELSDVRKDAGVSRAILVQAANNFNDTDWMLDVAANTDWIDGVVGWLPLSNPEITHEKLEKKYLGNQLFRGVRHLIHDEPDARWLLQENVVESLQILASNSLPYDVVGIRTEHLQTALELAEKVPGLYMIFDHLNQPPIQQGEKFGQWGDLMKIAASHEQFFVKISGLGTTCGKPELWNEQTVRPYIEFVLQHFGTDRCMCGSDWPVSLLAGDYPTTWGIYRKALSSLLNPTDLEKVFYKNAKRFYGL